MDNVDTSQLRKDWEFWSLTMEDPKNREAFLKQKELLSLHTIERQEIGDVTNKSLLHLQCRTGFDTLSWARLHARVVGVDYAQSAITKAKRLCVDAELDQQARFICADIYELKDRDILNEEFDIVYVSYGSLCWLKDLTKWGEIVVQYLKPGGTFYMIEFHPFSNILSDIAAPDLADSNTNTWLVKPQFPYFHDQFSPLSTQVKYGLEQDAAEHIWSHSLSEIMNALLEAGLQLQYIHEFDYSFAKRLKAMEPDTEHRDQWKLKYNQHSFPLLFSLKGIKPA